MGSFLSGPCSEPARRGRSSTTPAGRNRAPDRYSCGVSHPGRADPPEPGSEADSWARAVADVQADVRRVADRLRNLSQARLAAPVPGFAGRADAARLTAQRLADAAAGLADEPVWRDLPTLGDLSVGDQVAVTGHDAATALALVAPGDPAWTRTGRADAADLLAAVQAALVELRQVL